jgi:hypothetical protein
MRGIHRRPEGLAGDHVGTRQRFLEGGDRARLFALEDLRRELRRSAWRATGRAPEAACRPSTASAAAAKRDRGRPRPTAAHRGRPAGWRSAFVHARGAEVEQRSGQARRRPLAFGSRAVPAAKSTCTSTSAGCGSRRTAPVPAASASARSSGRRARAARQRSRHRHSSLQGFMMLTQWRGRTATAAAAFAGKGCGSSSATVSCSSTKVLPGDRLDLLGGDRLQLLDHAAGSWRVGNSRGFQLADLHRLREHRIELVDLPGDQLRLGARQFVGATPCSCTRATSARNRPRVRRAPARRSAHRAGRRSPDRARSSRSWHRHSPPALLANQMLGEARRIVAGENRRQHFERIGIDVRSTSRITGTL